VTDSLASEFFVPAEFSNTGHASLFDGGEPDLAELAYAAGSVWIRSCIRMSLSMLRLQETMATHINDRAENV
jgi:hypothetical protein